MTWRRIDCHKAAQRGDLDGLRQYLDAGGDASKMDSQFHATPIHWAALRGQLDAVQLLLDHGVPIESRTATGGTPLMWAAMSGNEKVCQYLLDRGSDPHAETKGRGTPLHHAASYGHADLVRLLLSWGADPLKRDNSGNAAGENFDDSVEIAVREEVMDIIEGARRRRSRQEDAAAADAGTSTGHGSGSGLDQNRGQEQVKKMGRSEQGNDSRHGRAGGRHALDETGNTSRGANPFAGGMDEQEQAEIVSEPLAQRGRYWQPAVPEPGARSRSPIREADTAYVMSKSTVSSDVKLLSEDFAEAQRSCHDLLEKQSTAMQRVVKVVEEQAQVITRLLAERETLVGENAELRARLEEEKSMRQDSERTIGALRDLMNNKSLGGGGGDGSVLAGAQRERQTELVARDGQAVVQGADHNGDTDHGHGHQNQQEQERWGSNNEAWGGGGGGGTEGLDRIPHLYKYLAGQR